MKKRYLIFWMLVLPILGRGQGFELFFGDTPTADAAWAIKTIQVPNENAYLIVLHSYENQSTQNGFRISKIDNLGNILWEKFYGTSNDTLHEVKYVILPTGFMVAYTVWGGTNVNHIEFKEFDFEGELMHEASYATPNSALSFEMTMQQDNSVVCFLNDFVNSKTHLVKVSKDGNLQWSKTYPDSIFYVVPSLALENTPDGGFLAVNTTYNQPESSIVTKFDQTGNLVWQTTLPFAVGTDVVIKPYPLEDAYFLTGFAIFPSGTDSFIAKVDDDGQLIWSQNFTSHADVIYFNCVVPGPGNTFYLTGTLYEDNIGKISLMQIGDDGNVLWEKKYSNLELCYTSHLLKDSNGDLFISANTASTPFQDSDPYLLKTNSNGGLIWSWQAVHEDEYIPIDAIHTSDGTYLIAGISKHNIEGYQNYLLKLDLSTVNFATSVRPGKAASELLKVYPQPAGEVLVFELKSATGQQPCRLEILNMLGQQLYDQPIKDGTNTISHLPAGQHFYRLWRDVGVMETGKVMIGN